MTIVVNDATSPTNGGFGTSLTWSHTVSSGSNLILVVGVVAENSDTLTSASGITYGAANLTKAVGRTADEGVWAGVELWYLVNPTVGTATVTVTMTAGVSAMGGLSVTLSGAAQQAPEATSSNSTTTDATSLAQAVTTLTDNAMVLSMFGTNLEDSQTSGQTQVISALGANGGGGCRGTLGSAIKTPAGSQNMTWTSSATYGRAAMVNASFAAATGSAVITLTDIAAGRVFQRSSGVATIPVAGTYTGTAPNTVEAKVTQGATTIVDWTTLGSPTIGSGAFSGTLASVPGGDGYILQVRSKNSGGTVLGTSTGSHNWGVGKVIVTLGSSTMDQWFTNGTGTPSSLLRKYDGSWAACTGSAACAFGNDIIGHEANIPVGLIQSGVSGSTLAQWSDNTGTNFTAMTTLITATGGKLESAVCHVGSNDARSHIITSQASQETAYRLLLSNLRSAVSQSGLPIFLMGCQRAPDDVPNNQWTWARAAEMNVADDTNNYFGALAVDLPIGTDNTHLTDAGAILEAKRCARAYDVVLLGMNADRKGPKPTSATYNATSGYVTVTFALRGGTGLVARVGPSSLTGFRVSTDSFSTLQTISAADIISPTQVRLKVPTSLSGVQVDYLADANPDVSNCLFSNGLAPS